MSTLDTRSDERRQRAVERLQQRADFSTHLAGYVLVNAVLVGVWVVMDVGFFWPIFPLAGWGVGVFFHGMETFRRPPTEERIQREMDRLR